MTEVVVDNGKAFASEESATIATEAAALAKQWAEESESQANIATRASDDAAQAKDDAVAAKEYAEAAVTDANLITVATDLRTNPSNIKTVANNISDVTTVSGISSNVTTVAGNTTNINTVAGISSNVTTVADNATDISAVAADLTNIDNASANAQLARDWAVKMDGLVASEDYSAKYYADQARQAAAGAVVDGVTINRNTNDELQTIGVIDDNNGNALKIWTGTKAEYETLLPTIDNNTLYNVTDTEEIYKGLTLIADKTKASSIISALGYTPADDTGVVHKTGAETIADSKTFTEIINVTNNIVSGIRLEIPGVQWACLNLQYNGVGPYLTTGDFASFLPLFLGPSNSVNTAVTTLAIGTNYVKFGNGLIIQWGLIPAGSGTYNFYIPFATGSSITLTGLDSSGVNNNNAVTGVNTTGFDAVVFGTGGAYWMAIGY